MEVKPGYKQTEVGVIPEDWEAPSIGEYATKVGSGITPTGGASRYLAYGRPFVRSQNIGWGRLILDDIVYIDDETHGSFSSTEIEKNDILINITGASIGRTALADGVLAGGNVNQHVCIVRLPQQAFSPKFINLSLISDIGQRQIDSFQAGGNRQGLNFEQVRSIQLPIPPTKAEQQAIAQALGDADALIKSLEQLIAKKRDIKQGAMQELLTGRKRLPGFSGEWIVKRLGDLANINSGGTPANNPKFFDGGVPWASVSDMTNSGKIILTTERTLSQDGLAYSAARLFPIGTVLYAMYASLGEVSIAGAQVSSSQAILGIRANKSLYNEFLYYLLKSLQPKVKSMGQQGTQSNLNKGIVEDFELSLPHVFEQKSIATILSDMDADLAALTAKLAKSRQIKQAMMQELLTGKVRLV